MTSQPVRPISVMELVSLATEIANDNDLSVGEVENQTQFEYLEAVLCELVSKLEAKQEFGRTHADLTFDLNRSIERIKQLEKSLRAAVHGREVKVATAVAMLNRAIETQVTHGQKNGMMILIREYLDKTAWRDDDPSDIPF